MFPERTKWLRRPKGWQKLGKVRGRHTQISGKEYITSSLCPVCIRKLYAGSEQLKTRIRYFHYCKNCMIKINTKNNV